MSRSECEAGDKLNIIRLCVKQERQWLDLDAPIFTNSNSSSQEAATSTTDKDDAGRTLLHAAAQSNQLDMVRVLVGELGADVDVCDRNGCTPLSHAIRNGAVAMARALLVDYRAAIHLLDVQGRSVLSLACRHNVEPVVEMLTDERGMDDMHRDNDGWTPLHECAHAGWVAIARRLVAYGSEVDARDNHGKTSLFHACEQGHLEWVLF